HLSPSVAGRASQVPQPAFVGARVQSRYAAAPPATVAASRRRGCPLDQALSKPVAPLTPVELADNDVPRAKSRKWSFTGRSDGFLGPIDRNPKIAKMEA